MGLETLSPRTRIVSSAYSMNSSRIEGHDLVHNGSLDLYVDANSGADTNDCLSQVTACETIQAALDRIPLLVDGDVTVHIGAGTYDGELILGPRTAIPKNPTFEMSLRRIATLPEPTAACIPRAKRTSVFTARAMEFSSITPALSSSQIALPSRS